MSKPIPLAYTFGNHMHWVDMQWLWGYDVLPGSIDDMLAYCRATGVKGNINFDGIGYEKLASESPEHLTKLRQAIADGTIEVVGASYGQPYGLFHGGESNVRQRVYGVRTAMRVLGCRPKTFWEEEFDCYPQLPQMLAGCGFTGASLYFQWTWHTPEVPMEEAPVVLWEGIDGTQIPTSTRNRMNLHQWPEDFQILLNDLAANPPSADDGVPPLVLQWLELMPTQDWMCRSELMIPMLLELKKDPRFEILALTLGDYLEKWKGKELPVRNYQPDDFWHGMTLGKNGDRHPKTSAELERKILRAETLSAIVGLFGRPYEPWDVYPTWEFEECWRNLLAFQHHDNHECEGLCGHVAKMFEGLIEYYIQTIEQVDRLSQRVGVRDTERLIFNHCGWELPIDEHRIRSMGYRVVRERTSSPIKWTVEGNEARFEQNYMTVRIDIETATILEFTTPSGTIRDFKIQFVYQVVGEPRIADKLDASFRYHADSDELDIMLGPASVAFLHFKPILDTEELEISFSVEGTFEKNIDPGYVGSVRAKFPSLDAGSIIFADTPYAVYTVGAGSSGRRKYPEGDWMTSPQFFESVDQAFTAQSFVNIVDENGHGILITHNGSQQWFRKSDGLENVILALDPWDGYERPKTVYTTYRLQPHRGKSNADCVKATAFQHKMQDSCEGDEEIDPSSRRETSPFPMPRNFSAVTVHSPDVLATAFYREQESFCKRGLDTYAGEGMGNPYILRLVEYDGIVGDIEVTLPGPIAKAFKTNLMGEVEMELTVQPDQNTLLTTEPAKLQPFGIQAVRVTVPMRAHEIATLYLDIVPGRKQFRDLDAKREIWATVHRVED